MIEIVGQMEPEWRCLRLLSARHGFLSDVIRTRQPRLIRHWSIDGPRVQVQLRHQHSGAARGPITVPLLVGDRAIGVLSRRATDLTPTTRRPDSGSRPRFTGGAGHRGLQRTNHQKLCAVSASSRPVFQRDRGPVDFDSRAASWLEPPCSSHFGLLADGIILAATGQRAAGTLAARRASCG